MGLLRANNSCIIEDHIISHELYPKEHLQESIRQFLPFCLVAIIDSNEAESAIRISAETKGMLGAEEIVGEFLNYLLDLSCRSYLMSAGFSSNP
jgi:hypothetical protein